LTAYFLRSAFPRASHCRPESIQASISILDLVSDSHRDQCSANSQQVAVSNRAFKDLAAKALDGANGLYLCCLRAHQPDTPHDKEAVKGFALSFGV
jgi:hypothetical protein